MVLVMAKTLKDGDKYKHEGKTYTWHDDANNLVPDDDPESTYSKGRGVDIQIKKRASLKTYSEKLRDPRWQKRKAEICQRDEWKCKLCGDNYETLHVHHKRYINGNEPWEYEDDDLITLCSTCHQVIEDTKKRRAEFDINKVRACLITNDSDALVCYRYHNNDPIVIMKRGLGVIINEPDMMKLSEFLKVKSDG